MELITQPAHPQANSYISLADAETYFSAYDRVASSDPWNEYSEDKKKFALTLAARALNGFGYKGKRVTKGQPLAFPRYTWRQINEEKREQYKDFFWATRQTNLKRILSGASLEISDNQLVDTISSNDAFYNPIYNEDLYYGQIIKQEGLSCDTFLTVSYVEMDGSAATIKETISDESAPSSGVTIYSTPLFGFPEEVGHAQAELAYQFVSSTLFQQTANQMPDFMPRSWDLGGNLSVTYMNELMGNSRFSPDRSSPIQIVYMLLGHWLSSVAGTVV